MDQRRFTPKRNLSPWTSPFLDASNHPPQLQIHVTNNLSSVELGALLWLLSLNRDSVPPDHFLRLGGGKPLGFGSVSPRILGSDLRSGELWRDYYLDLTGQQDSVNGARQQTVQAEAIRAYCRAILTADGQCSADNATDEQLQQQVASIGFINAFLAAMRGLDGPVHYPRIDRTPDLNGENFKWFRPNKPAEPLPLLKTDAMQQLRYDTVSNN